jgi:hypothetical protein
MMHLNIIADAALIPIHVIAGLDPAIQSRFL